MNILLFQLVALTGLGLWLWVSGRLQKLDRRIDEATDSLRRENASVERRLKELEAEHGRPAETIAPTVATEADGSAARAAATVAGDAEPRATATTPGEPMMPKTPAPPAAEAGGPPSQTHLGRPADGESGKDRRPRQVRFTPPRKRRGTSTAPPTSARQGASFDWGARLREQLAGADLEALIGGNWLNKLGVLVTVMGIALGLGYSFRYLGPGGRVGLSLAASLALLGGGVFLEPRPRYALFARGLIGGGWAALYTTTYAMHGLEAARIVESPWLGAALLLVVALGMVFHSLRYRTESVTGVAFLVAFATLAITPMSRFAAIASIPLAVATVYVAQRFAWDRLALLAVVSTYVVYLVGSGSLPETGSLLADFAIGQATLLVYWLTFEAFELMRRTRSGAPPALFALNAVGFTGVSLLQWSSLAPEAIGLFGGLATILYLVSAGVRARLDRAQGPERTTDSATRALSGSAEGALTIASAMAVLTIVDRFTGLMVNGALVVEAELLFVAGLYLGNRWLRGLASCVFVLPWLKLLQLDLARGGTTEVMGIELFAWTPLAMVMAAVFYLDRGLLERRAEKPLPVERAYTWAASAALFLVLAAEIPGDYRELVWLVAAAALFELGYRRLLGELRWQAYGIGAMAFVVLMIAKVFDLGAGDVRPWVSIAPATAFAFVAMGRLRGSAVEGIGDRERRAVLATCLTAGNILAAGLIYRVLPNPWVSVGWMVLALALVEAGWWTRSRGLRSQAYALVAIVWIRATHVDLGAGGTVAGLPASVVIVTLVALALYALQLLSRARIGVAGGIAGGTPEDLAGAGPATDRGGADVGSEPNGSGVELYAPATASVAATLLVSLLLVSEVSGRLLTVAWGVQGVALLLVGFALRERVMRLSGLSLLAICIVKVFGYDLAALEPPFRILSFIVLGVLLLGVSLVYTRARERLQRYL